MFTITIHDGEVSLGAIIVKSEYQAVVDAIEAHWKFVANRIVYVGNFTWVTASSLGIEIGCAVVWISDSEGFDAAMRRWVEVNPQRHAFVRVRARL